MVKKEGRVEGRSALKTVMFEGLKDDKFLSIFSSSNIAGPNINLAKGPKDDLLL